MCLFFLKVGDDFLAWRGSIFLLASLKKSECWLCLHSYSMESNAQYGGFSHDSSFMSLSVGGYCRVDGSSEEITRDMMLSMKSKPWGLSVSESTCDAGMALQNVHRESVPGFLDISKGGKRKRSHVHFGISRDLQAEDDSRLVLGLGCTPNCGGSSGTGTSLGTLCLGGREQEASPMDLGLGLTRSSGCDLTNDCLTSSRGIVSSVSSSARAPEMELYPYGSKKAGMHINTLLRLESLQSSSWEPECGGDAVKGSGVLTSNSGDSSCGMDLQLGLSGNSVSAESDCLSGMPLNLGRGGNPQESRMVFIGGEHVDEGSTSARWMKTGGRMDAARMNQTRSLRTAVSLPLEDPTEPDLSMSIKASTASASTCGISVGPSDRASKTCKFKGCGKGARGASGLCIAHGGGRRCQRPNCNKGAEGRTMYCKAHGGGRRCQSLGCIKSAEGKTDFCIGHGGGRRCNHEGCNKAARGRSGLCIRHGGGKRCQKEGCTKSAEGYSGLCISHGGGRRCQYLGCGKGAQGSTMFCKAHGGGRRCVFQGCTKGAEGSTPLCKGHGGGKRCMFGGGTCTKSVHGGTLFCVAHGGGKRCAVPGCSKSARGRTDYCVRHGGGKRCKFENCSKSAQGSTDFCKAHGGGKRCSWCQEGSLYSGDILLDKVEHHLKGPCDRFARGKTGLCAAHSALAQQLTSCSAVSKGTTPDLFHGLVAGSAHNGQNFQSSSEESEQPSQFGIGNDDDDQLLGTADTEIPQYTRASHEGLRVGHCHMESDTSHPAGLKAGMAEGRRQLTQILASRGLDAGSQVMPFDGISWSSFPNLFLQSNVASAVNMTDSTAGKTGFFAVVQHPHYNSGSTIQLPEAGSSFSPTFLPPEVLIPSSMQKGDLYSSHGMQHLGHACPITASDDVSNMSSLSLPEERVHGGGLMALLAREAARRGGPMQKSLSLAAGGSRTDDANLPGS